MNMWEPKSKDDVVTIPNIITSLGILFVFAYMAAFLTGVNRWVIILLLVGASMSDVLDGFFARRLRQSTRVGEMMDPFRDRLLLLAILLHMILVVGFSNVILGIVFFEILIVLSKILSICRMAPLEVHWVGKLRQLVHVSCGGIFIAKYYFLDLSMMIMPSIHKLDVESLLWTMVVVSGLTFSAYAISQLSDMRDIK